MQSFKSFKIKKNKKAFSLIEVVVALGIIGLIITLFFNILINVIDASLKSVGRSAVREELATVTNMLSRDLRNADVITNCGNPATPNVCEMITGGQLIRWERCNDNANKENKICRYIVENGNKVLNYKVANIVDINDFNFDIGYSQSSDTSKQNILFTLAASHDSEKLNINNVLKQVSVSTRNYDIPVAYTPDNPATDPCTTGTVTKLAPINYTISADTSKSCPWDVDDNYGTRDGYVQARRDYSQSISIPSKYNGKTICGFEFNFDNQPIYYDDDWILRLNDRILLISHNRFYNRFRDSGLLKVYDWRRIRGVDNELDNENIRGICAGGNYSGTAQCNVPTTEQQGRFKLVLSKERQKELGVYMSSLPDPRIYITITGDNNPSDCKLYNDFKFSVTFSVLN